jgi:hypothetical protein
MLRDRRGKNETHVRNCLRICIIFLLLAVVFVSTTSAQVTVEPADRPVSLDGVLRILHGFGPPGYGEDKKNDARISYWTIDLAFKVTVACTPSRPELADIECGATSRLRLFFPVPPSGTDLESRARKLVGHRATVTGVLHRRVAMYQITPVYMDLIDITTARPKSRASQRR